MAALTTQQRNNLPGSAFALPGRSYPLDTANRARNALSRISQFGSSSEKATVRSKVHSRYPGIGQGTKDKIKAALIKKGK